MRNQFKPLTIYRNTRDKDGMGLTKRKCPDGRSPKDETPAQPGPFGIAHIRASNTLIKPKK